MLSDGDLPKAVYTGCTRWVLIRHCGVAASRLVGRVPEFHLVCPLPPSAHCLLQNPGRPPRGTANFGSSNALLYTFAFDPAPILDKTFQTPSFGVTSVKLC